MQVTIDIPQAVADQLMPEGQDPARVVLEALAVDGYRTGKFGDGGVRQMLGYETPMQVHELLRKHDVYLNYSLAEFESDIETVRALHEEASAAK